MFSWKLSVLEIPLEKELTANCLVETHTKLEGLIPAAMVKYGMNRVQLPVWLKQSLINGFSWLWLVLGHSGQRTSVKCAEATWNYKTGGIVHLKSPAFFFCKVCTHTCYATANDVFLQPYKQLSYSFLQPYKPRGCHLYTIACCHHWPDTFIFHPKHWHMPKDWKVTLTTACYEKRIPI